MVTVPNFAINTNHPLVAELYRMVHALVGAGKVQRGRKEEKETERTGVLGKSGATAISRIV